MVAIRPFRVDHATHGSDRKIGIATTTARRRRSTRSHLETS
ncbi:hypothetical protein HSR121_2172 [Halapricum desulfuricans]|uniref:Uncharacterized protein n=1 Tax=Halapricum desulfuricans TaxID=2841257 RepID=A0A897N0P3_9EURY|nr:hypothetical protein HSR121_2172 [Halapricum desulfuricans]